MWGRLTPLLLRCAGRGGGDFRSSWRQYVTEVSRPMPSFAAKSDLKEHAILRISTNNSGVEKSLGDSGASERSSKAGRRPTGRPVSLRCGRAVVGNGPM